MTEIADDRTWWSDVEHLHPDSGKGRTTTRIAPPEPRSRDDQGDERRPLSSARRTEQPAVLRRADAAAFADAMDIDGAFGAPAPRSSGSREIVLTGATSAAVAVDRRPDAPEQDRKPQRERRAGHSAAGERRASRAPQVRDSRTAAERMGGRPDRIVMWVVMLGMFLVFIAAAGSSAGS